VKVVPFEIAVAVTVPYPVPVAANVFPAKAPNVAPPFPFTVHVIADGALVFPSLSRIFLLKFSLIIV